MFENLLAHRCDVYHLQEGEKSNNYGLPNEADYFYNDEPDKKDVKCYFVRKAGIQGMSVQQSEPNEIISEMLSAYFSIREDIRHNDKVVFNGVTYRIQNPIPIRTHHIEAIAVREESL